MELVLRKTVEFAQKQMMNVTTVDEQSSAVHIDGRPFILLDKDKLFDNEMKLVITDYDKSEADGLKADFVFEFGGNYYWTPRSSKSIEFNDFRYIGKCKQNLEEPFSHLGVHGGYEMMNGSGLYKTWCQKAKFYGHKALGICEYNTLAGVVAFQGECKDAKIKPIIGMTINITSGITWKFKCKLFVQNKVGWRNLLRIHKHIHIDGDAETIDIDFVLKNLKGLVLVLGWGSQITNSMEQKLSKYIGSVYYQIDSIIYVDESLENTLLNNVKGYIEDHVNDYPPVLLNDTYYIDKDYAHIKNKLNTSSGKFNNKVSNAYYKNLDDTFLYFEKLFDEDDERLFQLWEMAVSNTVVISDSVEFVVETGVVKMPRFEPEKLTGRYAGFTDNEELFWILIGDGLEKLLNRVGHDKEDAYLDRINLEVDVIKRGGFIGYFLVVWDILRWSSENGIYTGIGRGSAGGCMVAYLLDITRIDPIEYNLPFERFMNEGRMAGSLPDIDSDFEGLRRDDVKRYMESKYGLEYVCSIGSYSKLRVKAAMNEMWTDKSKVAAIKYMTAMILDRDGDWDEIFRSANKKKQLKPFVLDNVDFINNVRIVLDQPKNTSIHAAGVVIVPKEDAEGNPMTIFDWMPVTKRDGVLISEWEGTYLEKCGFMKNDILGTRQLDKFRYITNLIKSTTGDDVDIYSIPVDDEQVFNMFKEGWTEDTFHFGSPGLKSYTRSVKPNVIYDLIDTISLHRPALMDIGAHKEFVNIRNGKSNAHYDFMLKEITEGTNGILVYQEQVMEAVKAIGGFTMQEADDVRRAMGKKKIEVIAPYKNQFIAGAIERGCPPGEADSLWNKLELFSGYGFNRSHATAYAMTGYVGMWFKAHYPVQFWTAAFEYAKDEDIPNFVSEMNRSSDVKIAPPDINTSDGGFLTDYDKRTIHWSLNKIKQVGDVATEEVMEDRNKNGKYFSVDELFKRVTRKKVNRKVITSLIFAGCMDSLYDVKDVSGRLSVFKEYAKLLGEPIGSMVDMGMVKNDYWWSAKQKLVSGLGMFDYESIIKNAKFTTKFKLIDAPMIQDPDSEGSKYTICGMIVKVDPHTGGKGEFANILIDSNDEQVYITCWSDIWATIKKDIMAETDTPTAKILIISGRVEADSFKGVNVIATAPGTKAMVLDTNIPGKSLAKS